MKCKGKNKYKVWNMKSKLLKIWSTHCNNIVNNVVKFDNMMNNIVTILFVILSISTIFLPYMIIILLHNIVKIDNIVTILWKIFTIWWNNIIYDNKIVKIDNMVNNIVTILFTILSNLTTLLIVLLQYYFLTILLTTLRSVMAKAGDLCNCFIKRNF